MRRELEDGLGKRPGAKGNKRHALVAILMFDKPITRAQAAVLARRAIERVDIPLAKVEPWNPSRVKISGWSALPPRLALKIAKPMSAHARRVRARSKERQRLSVAAMEARHGKLNPLHEAIKRLEAFEPWTYGQKKRNVDVLLVLADLKRRMAIMGPLTEEDISGRPPRPTQNVEQGFPQARREMPTTSADRPAAGNHDKGTLARKDSPNDRIPTARGRAPRFGPDLRVPR